uniref:Uncharacterized protein n=1 Tax=Anguilla anguilla TaxID=7936 RepID=A0A0E9PZS0_ANGAN
MMKMPPLQQMITSLHRASQ